jgi:predicted transcriptional regulator
VVDGRTIESIRGSEWFGEELEKDLRTGNFDLWVHDDPVPHQIGLMDGRLCLGAEDENRMPVAVLETEDEKAVGWARECFRRYRRRSDRLESTDV